MSGITRSSATIGTTAPLPGPHGLPVIGNMFSFRRNLLGFLIDLSGKYGDISDIRVRKSHIVFLNSPSLVQVVLGEHSDAVEKRAGRDAARSLLLGRGLINSEGDFHVRQRKLCTPAFQPHNIAPLVVTMVKHCDRLIRTLEDGKVMSLPAEMNKLTMEIAGETMFGADLSEEASALKEYLSTARRYIRNQNRGILRLPFDWPTPANERFRSSVSRLDNTIIRLIHERMDNSEQKGDLLSLLLAAYGEADSPQRSIQQIRDEAVNLFWGGHEPAAITLTAAWYLLANHPDVNAKMRSELDNKLEDRAVTAADLQELPYTQQVLKEVLRMFPPIFAFGRQTLRPLELQGTLFPAGTNLMISPYTLHRRADTFPDPERFDPERFSTSAEKSRSRFAYLPFGSGPRFCIGSHFAQMEVLTVLATLGRRLNFTLVPGHRPNTESLITEPGRDPVNAVVRCRHA